MAETLNRFPTEPTAPLSPPREQWYTALVRIVNGLLTGAVDLATLIATNTAAIAAQALLIAANTAAIVTNTAAIALLQPVYGTWTPTDASGASLVFTSADGRWARIGRVVTVGAVLVYPATASGSAAKIGSLPVALVNTASSQFGVSFGYQNAGFSLYGRGVINTTTVDFFDATGAAVTNALLSTRTLEFSMTYISV